jgi:hypothetical protein
MGTWPTCSTIVTSTAVYILSIKGKVKWILIKRTIRQVAGMFGTLSILHCLQIQNLFIVIYVLQ